jgi:hypothetical protein
MSTLRRYALLSSPQSIVQAKAVTAQQWQIIQRSGQQQCVQLLGKTICTRWLVILSFKMVPQSLTILQNANFSEQVSDKQIHKELLFKASDDGYCPHSRTIWKYCEKAKRFVVKIVKTQQSMLSLLIFPDSIDRNCFRQLRAYLQTVRGRLE